MIFEIRCIIDKLHGDGTEDKAQHAKNESSCTLRPSSKLSDTQSDSCYKMDMIPPLSSWGGGAEADLVPTFLCYDVIS